ncbi:NADH dehydrogenase subunit NdhL [Anabaena sp. 90]|nr:NADH dehydrogenase subunit NdhL [Anabaena sp. 90]
MVVALLYLSLAGAYLLVIPIAVFFYLSLRWYTCGSVERVFMYFLVFFFFPGVASSLPVCEFEPPSAKNCLN